MKKITAVLGMLLVGVSFGFAQKNDPFLYNGDLSADKVKEYITTSKFLPLSINMANSFQYAQEKEDVLAVAKEQINRHHNYMAYYNAAVVCAADAEEHAADEFVSLSARDAANAINYATEAIKRSPNTPYMYLLRGHVYLDQGAEWIVPLGEFDIKSHDYARKALADYEKVMELKPGIAPYANMADLAKALRLTEKAVKYEQRALAQQRAADKANADQEARQQKAQRAVKQGMSEVEKNFWTQFASTLK